MIAPIFAFLIVVIVIPLVCSLADRAGFLDLPDGRKKHDHAVPPLGGAVIFMTFLAFMALYGSLPWPISVGLAVILVLGIVDDAWEVNAKFKFMIHFFVAFTVVIGGGAQIHSLGNLLGFGNIDLLWLSIPFSVACVVYIQNAVNMMDGVDGLAGGYSFLALLWLLLAAFSGLDGIQDEQIPILIGCLGGFLVYNMRSPFLKSAKIFLGDAGSVALGLMIAWYAITLSQGVTQVIKPISVAWIIALPIFDSFALLVTRLRAGNSPFRPDRRHFHHHFLNAGFTAGQTSFIIIMYSLLLGFIGFFGIKSGLPEYILGWGWICLWIGHTFLTLKSEQFIRLLVLLRTRIQHQ